MAPKRKSKSKASRNIPIMARLNEYEKKQFDKLFSASGLRSQEQYIRCKCLNIPYDHVGGNPQRVVPAPAAAEA